MEKKEGENITPLIFLYIIIINITLHKLVYENEGECDNKWRLRTFKVFTEHDGNNNNKYLSKSLNVPEWVGVFVNG